MDSATRRKAMTMYAQSCGVDVEKLEVTENGTYTAPSGKAYSPVIVNVDSGGGGNPNRVQTITGTLAEPFGNVNFSELMSALSNGNATAVISFVFSGKTVELSLKKSDGFEAINGTYCEITNSNYLGADVLWHPTPLDYSVGYARAVASPTGQIVDMTEMAPGITSTLTIIWHPLPE